MYSVDRCFSLLHTLKRIHGPSLLPPAANGCILDRWGQSRLSRRQRIYSRQSQSSLWWVQVIVGVGLNVANEEPSTCINVRLRERAAQLGHPDASSLSVSPEVRLPPIETFTYMRMMASSVCKGVQGPMDLGFAAFARSHLSSEMEQGTAPPRHRLVCLYHQRQLCSTSLHLCMRKLINSHPGLGCRSVGG